MATVSLETPRDAYCCLQTAKLQLEGRLQYGMSLPQTVQGSLHMEKGTVTDLRKLFHNVGLISG